MININDGPTIAALDVLKRYFGYDRFRIGQEELISGIMAGRDVLGVMPTGAGKSLCFQIPALMADGTALIISPLISLMKDQVNSLTQSGIAAAFINSSLTPRQIEKAMQYAMSGVYKLIYIAPERLFTPEIITLAQSVKISIIAVDEAHCISQWGQDFRPSYAQIPDFIAKLPTRPVVTAFTATATPRVREDIVSLLKLSDPQILTTGFNRQNLYFDVLKPWRKYEALVEFLSDKKERCGIVYCMTRKTVEQVCRRLQADGYNACRYHAGLSDQERHSNQDDFLYDRVQIMVATNAFGMGIDKSNVSFVVHYNVPQNVESYYQEAGRAGRDGQAADCIILYNPRDVRVSEWMIDNEKDVQYPDAETEKALKERNKKRLQDMAHYCTAHECYRGFILRYFGEAPPMYCAHCGSCDTNFKMADITVDAQKILFCVMLMNEKHEASLVIDILRGSKNEQIAELGFNKLSTFGASKKQTKTLRDIIDFLILNGHLIQTNSGNDTRQIIQLGRRADEVLRELASLEMILAVEKEPQNGASQERGKDSNNRKKERLARKERKKRTRRKERDKAKESEPAKTVCKELLSALFKIREKISAEQKVAPFIIFSDATLSEMCARMPKTTEELLEVPGVGAVKLEKYGDRFLAIIARYLELVAQDERNAPW